MWAGTITYKGRVAASRASLSLLLDLPAEESRRCFVVFVTPVCVQCEMVGMRDALGWLTLRGPSHRFSDRRSGYWRCVCGSDGQGEQRKMSLDILTKWSVDSKACLSCTTRTWAMARAAHTFVDDTLNFNVRPNLFVS